MIDAKDPNSPGWWLARLVKRLDAERPRYEKLDRYYTGEQPIPITATKACKDAYLRLMSLARTNYAELVVEAVRERMSPSGFRTGAESDDLGDKEAWRIWQANSLDADCDLVHRDGLTMSTAYVIVGGPDPDIDAPLITPEDPRQVITEQDPRRRRRTRAALKLFVDDADSTEHAYVYLPGMVFKAARPYKPGRVSSNINGFEWQNLRVVAGGFEGEALPVPIVPVVQFVNRPRTMGEPKGEFETHLSLLDRINYGVLHRLEIVTLQAFRQRAVKGVPIHDAQGNEIDYDDIFSADPGALWTLPETAEMWESGQVDLTAIHTTNRDDVMALAAVTRTPLHYLTPDASKGSAEGASLAREGLVFKSIDRLKQASESWEQVMTLGFLMAGDETRASRGDMECLWAPPERHSLAERADAASKATAGGVPWRTVMTDIWQFTPQQVDRMEAERVTDAFLAPQPAAPLPPQAAVPPPTPNAGP